MKNFLVIFVLLALVSCKSHRIDLSGDFDFVINNRKIASLNLTQGKKGKLTGFLNWSWRNDREYIFKITGQVYLDSYKVNLKIEIEEGVPESNPGGNYFGYVSDSNSMTGTIPVKWMVVRK